MDQANNSWKITGLAILPVRFVQGWIFWGGGSRRFIYDPSKLNPDAHQWMANKLQSAMPGAMLGVGDAISFILQHFYLLYASVIIFSLIELISGLGLIFGCCTRLAGFTTMCVSIILMLAFGWQGATCMDEWTMAVATLSMGFTLFLSGASIYSIDSILQRKCPNLAKSNWFNLITSGPLPYSIFKKITLIALAFTTAFTLISYNYFRGSIVTPYHLGPVSASKHNMALTNGYLLPNSAVQFTLYVDSGTPALPSNIIRVELLNGKNTILNVWDAAALSGLPGSNIKNDYDYNRVTTGEYGVIAPLSAKATITLPTNKSLHLKRGNYQLVIFTINGGRFDMQIKQK